MERLVEAKNIIHLSKKEVGEDIHIVKEVSYQDGKYEDNIRIIKDFKRPFWITKELYRTYKDKKEAEDIDKVNMYRSTESELPYNIAPRLGNRYVGIYDLFRLKESPYLYGVDVDSRTYLKKAYLKKNKEHSSPYRIGVFDIEVDLLTNKIILATLATREQTYTYVLKELVSHIRNPLDKIKDKYERYIPESTYKKNPLQIRIVDTEEELLKGIFRDANYANIDFFAVWNINYDIPKIMERCEELGLNMADIVHYDKIPSKYRFFSYKQGKTQKVTESGKVLPINPEEQWHIVKATTNYYFIDAMSAYWYVRVGGKKVPGGYSLNNVLEYEGIAKKLKFENEDSSVTEGQEWHIYMVKNKPIEYIIYNIWDTMAILELDDKTKDLSINVPILSGVSHFDVFNSGPRRIVDALTFFYLENKKVLGVRPRNVNTDKLLGLEEWIVTMPAYRIADNGIKIIKENPELRTNIRLAVYDSDSVSSYPSCIMAANVSRDTTHRELIKVEGIDNSTLKKQLVNNIFGNTNAVEFCTTMYGFPTQVEMLEKIKERISNMV